MGSQAVFKAAQECEYELERKRKIQQNNEMMKKIFGDKILEKWPNRSQRLRTKCSPVPGRAAKPAVKTPLRRNPKRTARSFPTEEESEESDSESTPGSRLVVRWVGPLTKKRRLTSAAPELGDDINGEHDYYDGINSLFTSKSKRKAGSPRVLRAVSDFTEDDLLLVAESVSEKHKDSEYGTTCHQCRQKTDDLKTVCRDESCIGIRGQFCGPCLRNRYGESVKEALLDPTWSCPPCRNICNCSFCMVKRGRRCTGQLIGVARQNGYQDVRSFLGD